MKSWSVYMLKCSDDSLYTGITRDVNRRVDEHNCSDLLAAKYTRARRPVRLVYEEIVKNRAEATRREQEIKRLNREEKLALI